MSTTPTSKPPMSGGKTALVVIGSVVGGVVVFGGLMIVVFSILSPEPAPPAGAPRSIDVSTMCSAITSYPDKRYTIATSAIPPAAGTGMVGTAASYRQAAELIDRNCPSNYQHAELLRGMARIYDPSGG